MTIELTPLYKSNVLLISTKYLNISGLDLLIGSITSLLLLNLLLRSTRC
jgi:hypothetical protein